MSYYANEWLDFLARWLHVVAAIVWIGTSFYFIALDNHLRPPSDGRGDLTEAWEIHGGGFYRVEKYRVAPPQLPEPLYWFKWEAYTTWLSGVALYVVVFFIHWVAFIVHRTIACSVNVARLAFFAARAAFWAASRAKCMAFFKSDLIRTTISRNLRKSHTFFSYGLSASPFPLFPPVKSVSTCHTPADALQANQTV